eukprot:PhM_4_TR8871/c0_g1_i1/m.1882/K11412/SIRT2, SIR2L2; NAD-dependent deacetylase sirtuin 2
MDPTAPPPPPPAAAAANPKPVAEEVDELIKDIAGITVVDGEPQPKTHILPTPDLAGLVAYMKAKPVKKVVVLTGAGISVAAGIPDFRTPGTGLYSQLEKYNLPYPEAIFSLDYLETNPKAFFTLAKEMWPGNYAPTTAHYFIRLLEKHNMLMCNFTQNIDGLERVAGVDEKFLVEAHGTFAKAHCTNSRCYREYRIQFVKDAIDKGEIPRCTSCCTKDGDGDSEDAPVVKPDIVFFGENLPSKFLSRSRDVASADLVLVLGTSLNVYPFAGLAELVAEGVPRVLINRECVGRFERDPTKTPRDLVLLGDCQQIVQQLVDALGWSDDLKAMMTK